jgi:hypothetical protein
MPRRGDATLSEQIPSPNILSSFTIIADPRLHVDQQSRSWRLILIGRPTGVDLGRGSATHITCAAAPLEMFVALLHTSTLLQRGCEVRLCHLLEVQPGNITQVVMAESGNYEFPVNSSIPSGWTRIPRRPEVGRTLCAKHERADPSRTDTPAFRLFF